MTPPAARLITLILLLQIQPNQKAAELARKLGISIRTLHRYFSMLDEMGIPLYSERGPHGGFSMVRGYKMPPLVFSPEEAAAAYLGVGLVEDVWGSLYRQPAQAVLAKLDNLLPEAQLQEVAWARRSLVATGMQRSNAEHQAPFLEKLRQAIRQKIRVGMIYRSSGPQENQPRQMDPYALVHRWGWWYVIGFCQVHGEVRSFRVDRIQELELTSHPYETQAGFDIQAYLKNELQEQPKIAVRLHFLADLAQVARHNSAQWEEMHEQGDGSIEVDFSAPDLNWAASLILAYGPGVKVIRPAALQRMVKQWAEEVARQYKHIEDGEKDDHP